jgi:uncharacterized protein YuzE
MDGSGGGRKSVRQGADVYASSCSTTGKPFTTLSLTEDTGGKHTMQAKYFPDTDTLLLTFSHGDIVETYDLNEDVLVEVDKDGHVVSMTVEHAKQQTDVNEFSYQLATA